jgi:hypothetical protein
MRNRARASGKFSRREIVDCEQRSRSPGLKIVRHLEDGVDAKAVGVVAVLVARGDHQQAKTNDVGERGRDLLRRARIDDAGGHAFGDVKASLGLAKTSTPASDDNNPPSIGRRSSCPPHVTSRATAA